MSNSKLPELYESVACVCAYGYAFNCDRLAVCEGANLLPLAQCILVQAPCDPEQEKHYLCYIRKPLHMMTLFKIGNLNEKSILNIIYVWINLFSHAFQTKKTLTVFSSRNILLIVTNCVWVRSKNDFALIPMTTQTVNKLVVFYT